MIKIQYQYEYIDENCQLYIHMMLNTTYKYMINFHDTCDDDDIQRWQSESPVYSYFLSVSSITYKYCGALRARGLLVDTVSVSVGLCV